jgi:ketosteroid isomerase-like protein
MGRFRDRVEAYFAACNTGEAAAVAAHFAPDACIYDLNLKPVRGDAIGPFWGAVFRKWHGAHWEIDSLVEDEAAGAVAIEWTMRGTRDGAAFRVSGSEHYAFDGDLIAEIRQYWIFDPDHPEKRLIGFPYGTATG